ncbi:MAG: hypothetical protein GX856_07580 [Gammaproteobacteria bacterium]|nr:hypothetical protein [Gammaproteobacteria bacterium]
MAEDAKADELVDQLRERFKDQIRAAAPDIPPHQALQLADSLCLAQLDVLAGRRVSYKARPTIDGDAIAESWRRGLSLREVMAEHKCSRAAAYKYHPNQSAKQARQG